MMISSMIFVFKTFNMDFVIKIGLFIISKKDQRAGFIAEDVSENVAMEGRKTLNSFDIVTILTKAV